MAIPHLTQMFPQVNTPGAHTPGLFILYTFAQFSLQHFFNYLYKAPFNTLQPDPPLSCSTARVSLLYFATSAVPQAYLLLFPGFPQKAGCSDISDRSDLTESFLEHPFCPIFQIAQIPFYVAVGDTGFLHHHNRLFG
jgi:hypothetical protein